MEFSSHLPYWSPKVPIGVKIRKEKNEGYKKNSGKESIIERANIGSKMAAVEAG